MSKSKIRKKPEIGDIIEVPFNKGFAYAQYVIKQELHGYLVRVLPNVYQPALQDYTALNLQETKYYCYLRLHSCTLRGEVRIAGNISIPEKFRSHPIMLARGKLAKNGRDVLTWYLWDGIKTEYQGDLKRENLDMSVSGLWDIELLKYRLDIGWIPRDYLGGQMKRQEERNLKLE